MDRRGYVDLGKTAIVLLLEQQHAAVWPEIEAKIADQPWPGMRYPIDPHHLTTARQELHRDGIVVEESAVTRGGGAVKVLRFADLRRRTTRTAAAASRKRLLHARYLGWSATSTRYPQGRVGPAGEEAVHSALVQAAPHGFQLVRPEGGPVHQLLGQEVVGGDLDSAAFLGVVDAHGIPQAPVVLPIEVKNRRHWVYPRHADLHQVLYKAAALQTANPGVAIVPTLICRRRHYTTFEMGKELGFYVIEVHDQFVLPSDIDPRRLAEVRAELGYAITTETSAHPRLTAALTTALRRDAPATAPRWAERGATLLQHYSALRRTNLPARDRTTTMEALRTDARDALGCTGRWCEPGW